MYWWHSRSSFHIQGFGHIIVSSSACLLSGRSQLPTLLSAHIAGCSGRGLKVTRLFNRWVVKMYHHNSFKNCRHFRKVFLDLSEGMFVYKIPKLLMCLIIMDQNSAEHSKNIYIFIIVLFWGGVPKMCTFWTFAKILTIVNELLSSPFV